MTYKKLKSGGGWKAVFYVTADNSAVAVPVAFFAVVEELRAQGRSVPTPEGGYFIEESYEEVIPLVQNDLGFYAGKLVPAKTTAEAIFIGLVGPGESIDRRWVEAAQKKVRESGIK